MLNGWFPDWVNPGNFLGLFTCLPRGDDLINHCDPEFDRAYDRACSFSD